MLSSSFPLTYSNYGPARLAGAKYLNHLARSHPMDQIYFRGNNGSEVPIIIPVKPKGFKARFAAWFKSFIKWFNPAYLIKRLVGFFQKKHVHKVISQLEILTPQKVKDIMAVAPLNKITYQPVKRQTTGIAKASHFYGPNDSVMRHHRDFTFLNILEDYGIQWSRFKVVRDALQNFYDGQGQTLEGVNIQVHNTTGNNHKVKIQASATYDVDKILALGGTGKKGETATAGGFGEGAKMMALILLRDYGAKKVMFRSGEWQAEFKLDKPGSQFVSDARKRGLMVKLSPLNLPINGNELEFDTNDATLASTFKDGDKLFYNAKNPIFSNPSYENPTGGFKLLDGEDAPGRVYEAGQLRAFGTEGKYDAIPGLMLWSHRKVLSLTDRDRVAIQKDDVREILTKIVDGMSLNETQQGIQTLRNHWFYKKPEDLLTTVQGDDKKAAEMLLEVLCNHYKSLADLPSTSSKKPPDFLPKGLVAVSPKDFMGGTDSKEQLKMLYESGYIPVKLAFTKLGIPDGQALLANRELLLEEKAVKTTQLTEAEKQKLNIISGIIKSFSISLGNKKLEKLSDLPIEVVSLPEKESDNRFLKLSHDEQRILAGKKLVEGDFSHAVESTLNMLYRKTYLDQGKWPSWILNNLNQMQTLQAKWEKRATS
jgi:hypothetical protein